MTSEPPNVVETTGLPEAIAAALEQVADGGRVIVVGPVTDIAAFPTYDELHVRGLELVVHPD